MAPRKKLSELKKLYEDRWKYPPAQKPPKVKYIACNQNSVYGQGQSRATEPCWKSPMGMTPDTRFGPCWDYPPERYKRYPLPPPCRGASFPVKSLVPKFDQCKTNYTRFDFRLEQCAHEHILHIEQLLRDLEQQLADAKGTQIQLAKQMRYQAIRRRLLIGSACGIKIYPEYLSQLAEQRALCDFQKSYNAINVSNAELAASVLVIRDEMPELRNRLDKLDHTLESPFLLSLETVLQIIQDLYDYFFEVVRKLKTWAQLIDAAQEHSVEDYLALLRGERDFESFKRAGTERCTCKRCRNKNPLEPYLPCWCPGRDQREKKARHTKLTIKPKSLCYEKIDIDPRSSDSGFGEKQSDTSFLLADLDKLSDE